MGLTILNILIGRQLRSHQSEQQVANRREVYIRVRISTTATTVQGDIQYAVKIRNESQNCNNMRINNVLWYFNTFYVVKGLWNSTAAYLKLKFQIAKPNPAANRCEPVPSEPEIEAVFMETPLAHVRDDLKSYCGRARFCVTPPGGFPFRSCDY